jgi:H+-transporting ATPase
VTPQLVKRVHELYEQLGREDVQAVHDWENTEPELQKPNPTNKQTRTTRPA